MLMKSACFEEGYMGPRDKKWGGLILKIMYMLEHVHDFPKSCT